MKTKIQIKKCRFKLIISPARKNHMARHFFTFPSSWNHTTKDCPGFRPLDGSVILALDGAGKGHVVRTPGRTTTSERRTHQYAKQWERMIDEMDLVWWMYLPGVQPPRSERKKHWHANELGITHFWTVHKSALG